MNWNDLVFKLQKPSWLELHGLCHQSKICVKFPRKRMRYKFRKAGSWGGCTGSVGQRPPNRFKQKRICEILSSKGQKNNYELGDFHLEPELGAESAKVATTSSLILPLFSSTKRSVKNTTFRENWQEHNFDDLSS